MKKLQGQAGFTLLEMMSVLAVSALFVGLILYFGISYWRYSSLLEADLDTFVSRLDAQDAIRDLVGTSSGLISQNSIADAHANYPDPVSGPSYWVTMHAVPATVSVGGNGTTTPLLYFRRFSTNTSKNIIMNGSLPYEDEYILYMDGSTKQLLLRSLANPNAPSNRLKTSCPAAVATTACPADRVILENVSSVTSTYYSRSGNTINYQSVTDPLTGKYAGPDFPLVEALQYTFHISKKSLFITTNGTVSDTVVRIALRNT